MSLSSVRPFFRDRLEALGFREHDQPFQPNQIGETIVNDSFHLETGTILSISANQTVNSFDFPVILRIYKKGFVDLLQAYDDIHQTADDVLADLLEPSVRLGSVIKNIVLNTIDIVPMDESNDNVLYLELAFTAKLELCYVTT